jgi:heme/copper-type cytochrome/quinol oxidase subunit 2
MSRLRERGQRTAIAAGASTVDTTVTAAGTRSWRLTWGTITAAASAVTEATLSTVEAGDRLLRAVRAWSNDRSIRPKGKPPGPGLPPYGREEGAHPFLPTRMALPVVLARRKPLPLAAAVIGTVAAALFGADPALALSLNPDAADPGIAEGNTLHTIMFVVIVLAIVAVNLAIFRAVRPRHRYVASEGAAAPARTGRLAAVLSLIAVGIFVVATIYTDASREVPESRASVAGAREDGSIEITATGQQWLWRFGYPNGAFGYHKLVVPKGVTVRLDLVSSDVIHGWNVPSLTGKAQAVPGQTNRISFRADQTGTFRGWASVLSGQGYADMESVVEVVEPDQYLEFIRSLKRDVLEAQDIVERQLRTEAQEAMDQ